MTDPKWQQDDENSKAEDESRRLRERDHRADQNLGSAGSAGTTGMGNMSSANTDMGGQGSTGSDGWQGSAGQRNTGAYGTENMGSGANMGYYGSEGPQTGTEEIDRDLEQRQEDQRGSGGDRASGNAGWGRHVGESRPHTNMASGGREDASGYDEQQKLGRQGAGYRHSQDQDEAKE